MTIPQSVFFYLTKHLPKTQEKIWDGWNRIVNDILPIEKQPEFLAQCLYESQGLRYTEENLNYTTTERIRKIFGKRVSHLADVSVLIKNPKLLAKTVYHHHRGLDNDCPEAEALYKKGWSVWDFRGQGYLQLTGFANWREFHYDTGVNCFKDKLYFAKNPWIASAYYWNKHHLDYYADFETITRIVNGGKIGLKDRKAILFDIYERMRMRLTKEK